MAPQRLDPPEGVRDLNSQPAIATDRRLLALRDKLKAGLPGDVFDDLSQWTDSMSVGMPPQPEAYRERALSYVSECIDDRKTIRPDSLRTSDELPEEVSRVIAGGWVWYHSDYDVDHDRPASDVKNDETGKFLLFAPREARDLENIVLNEFPNRPYQMAKLPTKTGKREDWVLCLYQADNRYWYDVRDAHHDPPKVRFRGYKANAATKRGEYSEQFENAQ